MGRFKKARGFVSSDFGPWYPLAFVWAVFISRPVPERVFLGFEAVKGGGFPLTEVKLWRGFEGSPVLS